MKLSTLNPAIGCTADSEVLEISFDCPRCGPPYRVHAKGRVRKPKDDARHLWSFEIGFNWSIGGTVPIDWDSITIDPSIKNHDHGRKRSCGADIVVSHGEVRC